MPYVVIHMGEGKTLDQKRAAARDITDVLCKDLDLPFKEGIQIEFFELPTTNVARGGILGIDMKDPLPKKTK